MKRSEFLRKLGIGLGVAVVAPQILANAPKEEEIKPLVGESRYAERIIDPPLRFISYDGTASYFYEAEDEKFSALLKQQNKAWLEACKKPTYFDELVKRNGVLLPLKY